MSAALEFGPLPSDLRSISAFLLRAQELKKKDPIISYYCVYYAIQQGMSESSKFKDKDKANAFLSKLLTALEDLRSTELKDKKEVVNNAAAASYIEGFASRVFANADKEDRDGRCTRGTAKKFLAAGNFLEVLKLFEEQDAYTPEIEAKIKYAKWKAGDIAKAFREGRVPQPGPASGDKYSIGERAITPPSDLEDMSNSSAIGATPAASSTNLPASQPDNPTHKSVLEAKLPPSVPKTPVRGQLSDGIWSTVATPGSETPVGVPTPFSLMAALNNAAQGGSPQPRSSLAKSFKPEDADTDSDDGGDGWSTVGNAFTRQNSMAMSRQNSVVPTNTHKRQQSSNLFVLNETDDASSPLPSASKIPLPPSVTSTPAKPVVPLSSSNPEPPVERIYKVDVGPTDPQQPSTSTGFSYSPKRVESPTNNRSLSASTNGHSRGPSLSKSIPTEDEEWERISRARLARLPDSRETSDAESLGGSSAPVSDNFDNDTPFTPTTARPTTRRNTIRANGPWPEEGARPPSSVGSSSSSAHVTLPGVPSTAPADNWNGKGNDQFFGGDDQTGGLPNLPSAPPLAPGVSPEDIPHVSIITRPRPDPSRGSSNNSGTVRGFHDGQGQLGPPGPGQGHSRSPSNASSNGPTTFPPPHINGNYAPRTPSPSVPYHAPNGVHHDTITTPSTTTSSIPPNYAPPNSAVSAPSSYLAGSPPQPPHYMYSPQGPIAPPHPHLSYGYPTQSPPPPVDPYFSHPTQPGYPPTHIQYTSSAPTLPTVPPQIVQTNGVGHVQDEFGLGTGTRTPPTQVDEETMSQAIKFTKFALSALNFEDIENAREQLKKALRLLS